MAYSARFVLKPERQNARTSELSKVGVPVKPDSAGDSRQGQLTDFSEPLQNSLVPGQTRSPVPLPSQRPLLTETVPAELDCRTKGTISSLHTQLRIYQ